MALTGLGLVGFIVAHLAGNLFLYDASGVNFNIYAYRLHKLGVLLYAAEIGLLGLIVYHAVTGIKLAFQAKKAKGIDYDHQTSKKGFSKFNLASTKMAITGSALLLFIVLHIVHFKYGPGISEGYVTTLPTGESARDLNRHVVEQFKNPAIVGLYVAAMLMLGMHLRHGIWSSFQSLGVFQKAGTDKLRYFVLGMLGILFAVGFISLPIAIYLR